MVLFWTGTRRVWEDLNDTGGGLGFGGTIDEREDKGGSLTRTRISQPLIKEKKGRYVWFFVCFCFRVSEG